MVQCVRMIRLRNLSKSYDGGRHTVVRNLDLTIEKGELLALLGESGSGKTTTLKMINRLVTPTAGNVEIGGLPTEQMDVTALRRRVGYVFQQIGLFPHMTVARNIAQVPELLDWPVARIRERVDQLLDLVDLDPDTYRTRMPSELSGGQQQRVGVARALAAEPDFLLMDEPFGALDPLGRSRLQDEFRRIHDELRLTTVLVTHDVSEALRLADRIGVMRDGSILQLATPADLVRAPKHEYVAALLAVHAESATRFQEFEQS